MPDSHEDLWSEEVKSEPLPAPLSILREQAALLGEKTNRDLRGEVETSASEQKSFRQSFYIVAPLLDEYRYRLFFITHDVLLYPLLIDGLTNELRKELEPPQNTPVNDPFFSTSDRWMQVKDEAEFKGLLKKILSAPETVRIVKSLLGQIRG